MQQAYFVSRQGYQEGPHSLELIEDKIKSGYLSSKDYIYDSKAGEWLWLSQFKLTRELFDNSQVTQPLDESIPESNWFLLKDQSQLGPYFYQDIVEMLLEKKAFEFDYVWSPGMDAWQRISECEHFTESKLKSFIKSRRKDKTNHIHFRRRSERFNYVTSLVLHNNQKLWNGKAFELSSSGASLQVEGQPFTTGELLQLHYRPSKRVPAFNVQCEVVSCQKEELGSKTSAVATYRLGLRFVKINVLAQKVINEIVYGKVAS